MNVYVAREGQTYGPYTQTQATEMLGSGQLVAGDLACPEGASDWTPLGQLLGMPAAPAMAQPQAAPAYAAVQRPAIPVAQPASAVAPPGFARPAPHGAYSGHMAASGAHPGSAAAQLAVRQLHRKVSGAFAGMGAWAALAVLFLGLPVLGMIAESSNARGGLGGFFGDTLGLKWGAIIGVPLAAISLWLFFAKKKSAAELRTQFLAATGRYA